MTLEQIERGTQFNVYEELDKRIVSDGTYEAEFRYPENSTSFVVRSGTLYERCGKFSKDTRLCMTFSAGPYIHTFTAAVKEKQRNGIVLVEQISQIDTHNRREFDRDEIRVPVNIFALPEQDINWAEYGKPSGAPLLSDVTFDVSVGGLCVITNTLLGVEHDPYYLAEFSLTEGDYHILPTILVRRSKHARTSIGRHDYGFQFILDHMPDETRRLMKGIINRKVFQLRR